MNLLITGAWHQAKDYIPRIESMGHKVVFLQQEIDELPCEASWVEGIIGNGIFLTHPIDHFPNLKYIQLTSAGYDRVPMDYVWEHNITIKNARGVYSTPMAEYALAGVLSLYKRLNNFKEKQCGHRWEKDRDIKELSDSTVVIVGCGSVGTECAKRFRAFGCKVFGIDIVPRKDENYHSILSMDQLNNRLLDADIVILTVPLTEETKGLIDKDRLDRMKGAVLVNISRGGVIDQSALEKWDGEAVLDVFEEEPLPENSPLWDKEGFIITPHNSFVGKGNGDRLSTVIIANMEGFI